MSNTIQDIVEVYNMLGDDESKDVYLKRMNYLITGDDGYIIDIIKQYQPHLWPEEAMNHLLNDMPKDKDFVMYGAGGDGRDLLRFVQKDHRFIGFCSRTKRKQKNGYLGCQVISPEELFHRKDLSVIVSTHEARDEIHQILSDNGYPQNLIFDVPFIHDAGQYFNPSFMKFESEEVLIDAGCYDLFNSLQLREYCKKIKKVYAFEPDSKNYEQCLVRKRETSFDEAEIFPFGTWSTEGTLYFSTKGKQSASLSTEGDTSVRVVAIDDIVGEDKITLIKMDVEGAELESLKGARNTILRDKPKMAICIYHKPEDMTEIPLFIKRLVPEYQLYVRHHSINTFETVLYAVIP